MLIDTTISLWYSIYSIYQFSNSQGLENIVNSDFDYEETKEILRKFEKFHNQPRMKLS